MNKIKQLFFTLIILIIFSFQLKCPEGFEEVPILYFEKNNQTDINNNLMRGEIYNFNVQFENQFYFKNVFNIQKLSSGQIPINSINIIFSNNIVLNKSEFNLTNFSYNLLASLNIKDKKIEFYECLSDYGCPLTEKEKIDSQIKDVRFYIYYFIKVYFRFF